MRKREYCQMGQIDDKILDRRMAEYGKGGW
jgi:hypothetical protein